MKKVLALFIVAFLIVPIFTEARNQVNPKNKFGGGSSMDKQSNQFLKYVGAGWVRPHYGPAIWDAIQPKANSKYDWDEMDTTVKWYQKRGYNILITIWPFATWDQKNRSNASECLLSEGGDSKAQLTGILPDYACNPNNWKKYKKWVTAMVERYDGDGEDDMPKLRYPITHWEVMNEPDLTDDFEAQKDDDQKDTDDGGETEDIPDFYVPGYKAYYKLLKNTSKAIRAADADAKVVIAGSAGGNSTYMAYWDNLFSTYPNAKKYFDIGNVHCVDNDYYNNYNVRAYKRMLTRNGMSKKNIWVTEASALVHDTKEENYTQTRRSTKKALAAGATKIFNVTSNLSPSGKSLKYTKKKFRIIIDKFNK